MVFKYTIKRYSTLSAGDHYNVTAVPALAGLRRTSDDSCSDASDLPTSDVDYERNYRSILRSVKAVREYALANDWSYFVTLTLNPALLDRSNYAAAALRLNRYFRNLRSYHGISCDYLLVPEFHSDRRNFHFHGLFNFDFNYLVPHPYVHSSEYLNYECPLLTKHFGFNTFSHVQSSERCSFYILKYVCKDVRALAKHKGLRLYYHSAGLKRPEQCFSYLRRSDFLAPAASMLGGKHYTYYSSHLSQEGLENLISKNLPNIY